MFRRVQQTLRRLTNSNPSRRRSRALVPLAAEVLEDRVLLTADGLVDITTNVVPTNLIGNNIYLGVISGDFNGNDAPDLLFWDPPSGRNLLYTDSGGVVVNVIAPTAINGNAYTLFTAGNFNGDGVDDAFFWNPSTGENRIVALSTIFTNVVAPGAINGNDFTQILTGNFSSQETTDLFFWNPSTGRNRFITFNDTNTAPPVMNNAQTNAIQPTAINGNDFVTVVAGRFNNDTTDDLFFWNPDTGRNRTITTQVTLGTVSQQGLFTNTISSSALNGNDFNRLTVGQFNQTTTETAEDLFFWNTDTGRNRLATGDDSAANPVFTVDTNCVAPGALNTAYNAVVTLDNDTGFDTLFFWGRISGANRVVT